ncbi:SDR family oxidoreductase [Anatilimnocola floriformis]|uniref:SDR family oxidoreductase n=1 Tax=Anatilimnocola floriformis TaxID=2948575 RepID=UPI0020C255C6|nr:SDR family oxidoreductase [Anatilimnocola floriformis]
MARLTGKTALITGGGTGIGWGIAKAFAEEGVKVAIAGRRLNVVQETASSWKGQPAMLAHDCDVGNRESVNKLFAWAKEQLGQIDILVNAAGVNIKTRSMSAMTPDQWDDVMNINATGVYNCLHAGLPAMIDRKDGLIINISSISGKRSAPLGGIAYNASKFAVAGLCTAVANEVAPHNVRITTIYPGEVDTPILEHRPSPVSAERRAKMVLPEDFGPVVVALALLPPRTHVPELIIKPTVAEYF